MKHNTSHFIKAFALAATTALSSGCDWIGCDIAYETSSGRDACYEREETRELDEHAESTAAYRAYINERVTPEQRNAGKFFSSHLVKFIPVGHESPGYSDYRINNTGKSIQESLSNNVNIHEALIKAGIKPETEFNAQDLKLAFDCHNIRPNPIGVYGGKNKQDTLDGRRIITDRIETCITHNQTQSIAISHE